MGRWQDLATLVLSVVLVVLFVWLALAILISLGRNQQPEQPDRWGEQRVVIFSEERDDEV